MATVAALGLFLGVSVPAAHADGQAIVNAAQAMENAGYPYCFDGGTINGPTVGTTDSDSDGSYSNCSQIGRVGFDCTGLTLYAVYHGTGNGGLSHDGYQAKSGGGQVISSESDLQPGDIVYFDYNRANGLNYIDHAGVYVGNGNVLSAVSEKYGIRTESISWYEAGGLHFVGAVRYWSGATPPGGGAPSEGALVSYNGNVYRIAGGAPLYVSNWSAVGGPQPTEALSAAQWAALNAVPSNGTFINSTATGMVYEIAGGAPLYVSSWSAVGGSHPSVGIDQWDLTNITNPLAHMNAVPSNGTLIGASAGGQFGGEVFVIAGGAPLYVSNWNAIGGPQPVVGIDEWDIANITNPAAHLNAVPSNGTFINTSTGHVYRIAGGAPFAVSSWSVFGGEQPYVTMDMWDIDNITNPAAHLNETPADGTIVEGLPSTSYWSFSGGYRNPTGGNSAATQVDDVGLAAFPQAPSAVGGSGGGGGGSGGSGGSGSPGGAGPSGSGVSGSSGSTALACLVPNLDGLTLDQARSALSRAHCQLGKVHMPRHGRRDRVSGQSARRGSKHRANYAVNITLKATRG